MECPSSTIALFNLVYSDMGDPNCLGRWDFKLSMSAHCHLPSNKLISTCRCTDYLIIDRGSFGSSETCGNGTEAAQLELGESSKKTKTNNASKQFNCTCIYLHNYSNVYSGTPRKGQP